MFHRDRGCCGDCGVACTNGTSPGAEPLKEQPKKMPSKTEPKKATEARINNPPGQAPPVIQNAPTIAPALAPRIIENDARNPF